MVPAPLEIRQLSTYINIVICLIVLEPLRSYGPREFYNSREGEKRIWLLILTPRLHDLRVGIFTRPFTEFTK